MSFDIFFFTGRYTTTVDKNREPDLTDVGLNPDEVRAVSDLLARYGTRHPEFNELYNINFPDGGSLDFSCRDVAQGGMVEMRCGITPNLLSFLFDLVKAGNWVMIPTIESAVAVTATPDSLYGLPEDFPPVVVVSTPEEIGRIIMDDEEQWQQYRAQIVRNAQISA